MTYSESFDKSLVEINETLVEIKLSLEQMKDTEVITKGDKIIYLGHTYFYIGNDISHHLVGDKFLRVKLHIPNSQEDKIYKVTGMTDSAIRDLIKIYEMMDID